MVRESVPVERPSQLVTHEKGLSARVHFLTSLCCRCPSPLMRVSPSHVPLSAFLLLTSRSLLAPSLQRERYVPQPLLCPRLLRRRHVHVRRRLRWRRMRAQALPGRARGVLAAWNVRRHDWPLPLRLRLHGARLRHRLLCRRLLLARLLPRPPLRVRAWVGGRGVRREVRWQGRRRAGGRDVRRAFRALCRCRCRGRRFSRCHACVDAALGGAAAAATGGGGSGAHRRGCRAGASAHRVRAQLLWAWHVRAQAGAGPPTLHVRSWVDGRRLLHRHVRGRLLRAWLLPTWRQMRMQPLLGGAELRRPRQERRALRARKRLLAAAATALTAAAAAATLAAAAAAPEAATAKAASAVTAAATASPAVCTERPKCDVVC